MMSTSPREQEITELKSGRVGPLRDLQQVREGTATSLAEMREFLSQLKGRRPQEVIGIVSASLLIQSLVVSSFLVVVILFAFTIGPYLVYGPPQTKRPAPERPVATVAGTDDNAADTNAQASASPSLDVAPAGVDAEQATKVMGLDDVKPADPDKNPLDGPSLDDLLDGID
ncbi:MAG: hypothetical protein R3C05_24320 [Pirellulaceae bacterium]